MITRGDTPTALWAEIAAPLDPADVQWRINGKPKQRDGKWFAPFVAYIDAQCVRDRLDRVVPGEWDLTLELLPTVSATGDGEVPDEPCAFKARLQVLGVIREDVGTGRDYKTAATDAFKRAAVRFGVGHELYTDYEILWVQVDGDGKYAKAIEEPSVAYARRQQRNGTGRQASGVGEASNSSPARAEVRAAPPAPAPSPTSTPQLDEPACPKCGGRMWDNRLSKRNPKAPDFACRSRSCEGVIWPPKKSTAVSLDDDAPPPDDGDFDPGLGF